MPRATPGHPVNSRRTGKPRRGKRDPASREAAAPAMSHRAAVDAWLLTDIVTRLRRVLRASIRSDYPWETLPMAQVEILQRLHDEPGLRINDLAARHRLATNTVSTLVKQMVLAHLITRSPDNLDQRAVRLNLTPTGLTMLRDWQRAHESRIAAALDRLDATDHDAVLAALPALARLVDELEAPEIVATTSQSDDAADTP